MIRMVGEAGIALIKGFEGLADGDPLTVALDPYLDPIGVWTIGWGHAISVGHRVLQGEADRVLARRLYPTGITILQAEELLRVDLAEACRDVEMLVSVPLTNHQFDALVSFDFNLGAWNLGKSTLLRKLNARDYRGCANEFPRWNRAGGVILNGLVRRRAAEAQLFRTP